MMTLEDQLDDVWLSLRAKGRMGIRSESRAAIGARVTRARELGMTWKDIASALMSTPKTAQKCMTMYDRWESTHKHRDISCGCELAKVAD